MPELPEVEATRVLLTRQTSGRRIVAIAGDPLPEALEALTGAALGPWLRRGKRLVSTTDDGRQLCLHLGMTGKIVANPEPLRGYVRVSLTLDDDSEVAFIDTRRLGSMALVGPEIDPFDGLGPDALALLEAPDAAEALAERLAPKGRTPTSAILKDRALDQARVSGLGNIAIIEGCFRAGVHPHQPATDLSKASWQALSEGLLAHLTAILADCLETDEVHYVTQGGPNRFLVYRRAGEACPRCPTGVVIRLVRAGRPTFVCPRCQTA